MQASSLRCVRAWLLGPSAPLGMVRTTRLVATTTVTSQEEVRHPDFAREFRGREEGFPCLNKHPKDAAGVTGAYGETLGGHQLFQHRDKFHFKHGGVIPELYLAYETWGQLNQERNNAILLHTGLSGSSHAKSHKDSPSKGWWEKFIGPSCALDTNRFFVVCSNLVGGCYGSIGPSSINPLTGREYAMSFPLVTIEDMVHAQFLLLDRLGVGRLHAAVGASLGGMQSLMAAAIYPERVGRVVSISACVRTHPSSIAMRYVQRRILMADPNWNNGRYYGKTFPRMGMQHAREVGTITYRSGPEWAMRFGHKRAHPDSPPDFCPDFEIERYLEYQGEKFSTSYDPNSLLYISKAMDLFDMGDGFPSLQEGVARVQCPVLILGVNSDILFPVEQQRLTAELLREGGNARTTFYELNSIYGHDTFMLDLNNVGAAVKGHLESELNSNH